MSDCNQAHLQVRSDLKALDQVLTWFEQFNSPPLPYSTWIKCQTALVEGFTNAVRHAHRGYSPDTLIDIEVTVYPQILEIRIWDRGPGFDLDERLKKDPPSNDATGGRGVRMMKDLSDRLSYTPTADSRYCLLFVKHFEPSTHPLV